MPNYNLIEDSMQWNFQRDRHKVQIVGGGFANGKTTALVIKCLGLAKNYPGSTGLLGRETYPKLNDTLRKEFFKWCPSHWVKRMPTQEDNTVYLVNGSVVHFRYIAQRGKHNADGTTTSNLLSATYDYIGLDQIEDAGITHKDFLDLVGRLRGDTPYRPLDDEPDDSTMPASGPRWIMMTLNPSQTWAYHEIIKPYMDFRDKGIKGDKLLVDEETGESIVALFESDTYANRANLKEDFIRTLEIAYKGQMRERYLLGKWAAFEGLVYSTFDTSKNVIKREEMRDYYEELRRKHVAVQLIEGYDFGLTSPSCYLYGFVDDWGRVFIIDGFYQPNFDVMQHGKAIREVRMRNYGAARRIWADPAIFKRIVVAGQQVVRTSIANILKNQGLSINPASNDMLSGIAKVTSYINGTSRHPHIVTEEADGPLLYIAEELAFIQDEMSSYFWKKDSQQRNLDEPMDHCQDHALDTIKYMLSKLPEPSEIVIPKDQLPPSWTYWQDMSMEDYDARLRSGV